MQSYFHFHPMLVHFPVALLIAGFICEILKLVLKKDFFHTAGLYLLIAGTVCLVGAYLTGAIDGSGFDENSPLGKIIEDHESAANITLWLFIGLTALKIFLIRTKRDTGKFIYITVGIFLIGILSILYTGYTGGILVYNHSIGVTVTSSPAK